MLLSLIKCTIVHLSAINSKDVWHFILLCIVIMDHVVPMCGNYEENLYNATSKIEDTLDEHVDVMTRILQNDEFEIRCKESAFFLRHKTNKSSLYFQTSEAANDFKLGKIDNKEENSCLETVTLQCLKSYVFTFCANYGDKIYWKS